MRRWSEPSRTLNENHLWPERSGFGNHRDSFGRSGYQRITVDARVHQNPQEVMTHDKQQDQMEMETRNRRRSHIRRHHAASVGRDVDSVRLRRRATRYRKVGEKIGRGTRRRRCWKQRGGVNTAQGSTPRAGLIDSTPKGS